MFQLQSQCKGQNPELSDILSEQKELLLTKKEQRQC